MLEFFAGFLIAVALGILVSHRTVVRVRRKCLETLKEREEQLRGFVAGELEARIRVTSLNLQLGDANTRQLATRECFKNIIEWNRRRADEKYEGADKAEAWPCVQEARRGLGFSEHLVPKEKPLRTPDMVPPGH